MASYEQVEVVHRLDRYALDLGAAVLRGATTITNDDGTTSFLPNAKIFMAALAVVFLLIALLSFQEGLRLRKGDE